MQDRNLKQIRKWFGEDHIDGHELDEMEFIPNIYQRIFFFEECTRKQARESLQWLWHNIRSRGFSTGNKASIAVVAYPLTADFQNWELFADVSDKMAAAAIKHSASLISELDNQDCAITAVNDHPSSHVLPNRMLTARDVFSDRYCLFLTTKEVADLGSKMPNVSIQIPA